MAAARPDTWMPMFWGDYFKDTNHLSTLEHGAYMLLIGHYWSTGAPPQDSDAILARIARLPLAGWRRIRPVIEAFFAIEEGLWRHGRVDAELDRATRFIEKQTENGKRGGRPPITQTKPNPKPKPNPNETTSSSPSTPNNTSHGEISNGAVSASASPHGPPRSSAGLPDSAKWTERLAGYRPWEGRRVWQPFWGPPPDSLQTPTFIPPLMHRAWKTEYDAAKARGEAA